MDDLIARANKYAKSAGRIGEGQYRAARENEAFALLLSSTNTILSAVVGTSIFAQWVQTYPLPFGVAAIVAAALSAVQRTSKLEERAEAHRMAGAEYCCGLIFSDTLIGGKFTNSGILHDKTTQSARHQF